MSYYDDYENDSWSGTNGYGERIINPEAYYQAVNEDRYGFNSNYSEHQRDNYYSSNADIYGFDE
jgi:hypothetical protein